MNLMPVYEKFIVASVKTLEGKSRMIDPFRMPMREYTQKNWEFAIIDSEGKEYRSLTYRDRRWYEYYKSKIKKDNLLFICWDSGVTDRRIKIFESGAKWGKHLRDTIAWCEKEIGQLSERQKTIQEKLANYRTLL